MDWNFTTTGPARLRPDGGRAHDRSAPTREPWGDWPPGPPANPPGTRRGARWALPLGIAATLLAGGATGLMLSQPEEPALKPGQPIMPVVMAKATLPPPPARGEPLEVLPADAAARTAAAPPPPGPVTLSRGDRLADAPEEPEPAMTYPRAPSARPAPGRLAPSRDAEMESERSEDGPRYEPRPRYAEPPRWARRPAYEPEPEPEEEKEPYG